MSTLTDLTVREVMTCVAVTIESRSSIGQFLEFVTAANVHGAPVVDSGRVVGVVSMSDVVVASARKMSRSGFYTTDVVCIDNDLGEILYRQIGEIMTREIVSIDPDRTLREACKVMTDNKVQRLLALDSQKRLLGILSSSDVIRALSDS